MRWPTVLAVVLLVGGCPDEPDVVDDVDTTPRALYVDQSASIGGDGSQEAPLRTIAEAIEAAEPQATIHIADGDYLEQVEITLPVTLSGAGTGTLLGQLGSEPAVTITSTTDEVVIRDMELVGISITSASVHLDGVTLTGQEHPALAADQGALLIEGGRLYGFGGGMEITGGDVEAREVLFEDLEPFGVSGTDVESLLLVDCQWRDIRGKGVELVDSDAELLRPRMEDIASTDTVEGNGADATGGTLVVNQGQFARIAVRGIVARSGEVEILGSEFTGIALTGVAIFADESGVAALGTVRDSEFADLSGTSLYIAGSDVDVIGNYFESVGMAGILASDDSTLTIQRNVFEDSSGSPISLLQVGNTEITDCIVNGADETCVFVTYGSGDLLVENNTLTGCLSSAISVSDRTGFSILNNAISEIGLDPAFGLSNGIAVLDAEGTVEGNHISDMPDTGIMLVRSAGSVSSNELETLDGAAIQVTDSTTEAVVIDGNTITNALGPGIIAVNSNVEITENTITGSRLSADGFGDGIAITSGSEAQVLNNNCLENARNGIVVIEDVTAHVDGNLLRQNGEFGLRVFCESDGVLPSTVTEGENLYGANGLGPSNTCD